MAFSFAPMVSEITLDATLYIFNPSTAVYMHAKAYG